MIRSNFNKITLLANEVITIEESIDNIIKIYKFRMPSVLETTEFNFYTFLSFCIVEEEELKNWFKRVEFKSRYELFKLILNEPNIFRDTVVPFFEKYWLNWNEVADDFLTVSKEVFDLFCLYLAVACGQKKFKEVADLEQDLSNLTPEELEWKKREKEYEDIISKTKAKKSDVDSTNSQGFGNELVIAAVVHDFSLSMKEVLDMNFFTLYYYFSLTEKLGAYNIDLIASATGSTKKGHKHKYWVNI